MEILIRDTPEEGAKITAKLIKKILSGHSKPILGLATGGTPLRLYHELIHMYQANELIFKDFTSFNLDEYVGLPPEDERSYHHYMAILFHQRFKVSHPVLVALNSILQSHTVIDSSLIVKQDDLKKDIKFTVENICLS